MSNYVDIALEIGKKMIENGAEIHRVEDTVQRICEANGAKETSVFSIPSFISVSVISKDNKPITRSKRIYENNLNLGKIDRYNSISRAICKGNVIYKKSNYKYSVLTSALSVLIATGAFSIYFGGTFKDAVFAGIAGLLITILDKIKPAELNIIISTFIESLFAGLFTLTAIKLGAPCSADKVMIGAIMLLIPGMSVGNSIKDLLLGDTIAGILQLITTLLIALSIVFGFALSYYIIGG